MEKIEIDKNKALSPGDIIEMHFTSVSMFWITAVQLAMIEWKLQGRKDFRIHSYSQPTPNKIIYEIRIIGPVEDDRNRPEVLQAGVGVAVTAAIIGAAIIGAGIVAWLTLDKVYQIMESPAGKVGVAGVGALGIAAAIAIVLALLPRGK